MSKYPLYEIRHIDNLKDMLDQSVKHYGSKAAFLVKYKNSTAYSPVTYSQFKQDVEALGTALLSLGVKGKRIAILGENRYEWATTYLAVVNGLGTIVPLDKELPESEVENLLIRSEANAVIFSGKYREQIRRVSGKVKTLDFYIDMDADQDTEGILSYPALMRKGTDMLASGDTAYSHLPIDVEKMSILLFTSGTTDLAKAVSLSQKNICSNLMAMCSMLYIDDKDTFLSVLPLHHTYECTCGFLCPIYRGATVAYCEGLRHITKNMQEAKVTLMLGVPLIFESMYKRILDQAAKKKGGLAKLRAGMKISDFLRKATRVNLTKKLFAPVYNAIGSHIRLFISGAAAVDPLVAKGFRSLGIDFLQGYGLSECSPILALNRDYEYRDAAAGLPLPGVEVRIHQPGSDGVGEIIAKGNNIMLGYYENPELTAKVLKDGWFYTGDLGYMDSDGFVYITGRKKNVIVTKNGKNIFPEEVETYLSRSPYIKESLVWGKSEDNSPDVVVCATIVPEMEKIQEDFPGMPVGSDELYKLIDKEVKSVNKNMPLYKHIREFTLREEEFTKTTTKKIKRYIELGNH